MTDERDLSTHRRPYADQDFREADAEADPYAQFGRWFADAEAYAVPEPNAMVLATASPDGQPSTRTVLLKGYDARGFRFFTNGLSRKGRELAANPQASLCFPWHVMARQVVVIGAASPLTQQESLAYFRSRPYDSQLGAVASEQSSVVGGRDELVERYEQARVAYPAGVDVPMPQAWGGWRVEPETVEFWQGRPGRLHDRLRYRRERSGWVLERLSP